MHHSSSDSGDSGFYEINVIPLIDVSLVLVVILLLATPLAMESSIGVRSRALAGRNAEKSEVVKRLELMIVDESTVRVNRVDVSRANLASTIRPMIASSPDQLVVVRCADQVSHGVFVSVLDEAKMSGAAQIAIVEN